MFVSLYFVTWKLLQENTVAVLGKESCGWGYRQVAGCCMHGNELFGSIKCGEFLDYWKDHWTLKKNCVLWNRFSVNECIATVILALLWLLKSQLRAQWRHSRNIITSCAKLSLSLQVIDGGNGYNDGGHDDDNKNSAIKWRWFPNCCLEMSPALVIQKLFIDFAFPEQEGRTRTCTVNISYVLAI